MRTSLRDLLFRSPQCRGRGPSRASCFRFSARMSPPRLMACCFFRCRDRACHSEAGVGPRNLLFPTRWKPPTSSRGSGAFKRDSLPHRNRFVSEHGFQPCRETPPSPPVLRTPFCTPHPKIFPGTCAGSRSEDRRPIASHPLRAMNLSVVAGGSPRLKSGERRFQAPRHARMLNGL